jgi:predicted nucleic acid-binding protein
MDVQKLEGVEDLAQTMEIAHEKNLSFYDAAYIQVARRMGLTLGRRICASLRRLRNSGLKQAGFRARASS